jgi:hypothetical protein
MRISIEELLTDEAKTRSYEKLEKPAYFEKVDWKISSFKRNSIDLWIFWNP